MQGDDEGFKHAQDQLRGLLENVRNEREADCIDAGNRIISTRKFIRAPYYDGTIELPGVSGMGSLFRQSSASELSVPERVRRRKNYRCKKLNENMHPLIKELRIARFAQNIGQQELAKKIGISNVTLNRLENENEVLPSMKVMLRWTRALGYELTLKKVS